MRAESCWVLTEGHAGMESQGLGLAQALGCRPALKRARLHFPWNHVPPGFRLPPLSALRSDSDGIEPPWPDILISCGRRSVGLALAVKRRSAGRTFAVHIQDPHVDPAAFDLVAAPRHDELSGRNVVPTLAAIHHVTPERLAEAARRFAPALAALPRPLVAVLIGGSNRRQSLVPAHVAALADQLAALCRDRGAGLAVTPSRRTGAENEAVLRSRLAGCPAVIWDGAEPNPYFGYLALADAIVVTGDSVSMVSEACATGKPVYVVEVEGGSRRFRRFHESLRREGMTRPFGGVIETWSYTPPDDTARVADAVRRRMAARRPPA